VVLVVGATGSLGSRIAHQLLEGGERVRALARPASNRSALETAGAEVVLGDLKDPASLDRACNGMDVVITTASMSKRGDDTVENVELQGNQNLITAAEKAGVRHFIFVSTIGASPESPVPVFRAKAAAEQRLREGRMMHTILQANAFMDVWFAMLVEMPLLMGQPVTVVGESRRRHSFIAEQDVAAFAIAAMKVPASRNTTLALGGPDPLTFRDVIDAYGEAAGRSIPVRSVAPGEAIPGLPPPVWAFAAALESFDSPIPMKETARVYGVTPTSVRDFARSRFASDEGLRMMKRASP
jgi:NADH dehydrogenase